VNKNHAITSAIHKDKTLVVVDMQGFFLKKFHDGHHNPVDITETLITNCRNTIRHFAKGGAAIIFVEYELEAEGVDNKLDAFTHPAVKIGAKGCKRVFKTTKWEDDGAGQVSDTLNRASLPTDIYMIGINGAACVMETANSLGYRLNYTLYVGTPPSRKVKLINHCVANAFDNNSSEEIYEKAPYNPRYTELVEAPIHITPLPIVKDSQIIVFERLDKLSASV
jgi:hypothetical protein